jgi:hypothetical protein
MSDGPPTCNGKFEASCWLCQQNQRVSERNQESRRKAFISDYYRQNSTQREPGWFPWDDLIFVMAQIVVGLLG